MTGSLLEVIALNVRDAVAAEQGGADRLEIVADMAADGLTPHRRRSPRSPPSAPCPRW
ncbi:hypothetical protein ACFQ0B_72660 [Nonomuraea thailandensis]